MNTIESEKKQMKSIEDMTFEECYMELEKLVEKFESGKMTLSESITLFERGMHLLKKCSQELSDAEKKVADLLEKIDPNDLSARNPAMDQDIRNA